MGAITPEATQHEVVYQIDSNDLLVFVNDEWELFARENGSPHLAGRDISRSSVWNFIHDAETRLFHAALLEKVRAGRRIRCLPFRCDSPALRRFMEMDISTGAHGCVEYRCRVIKTEARDPVPLASGDLQADEKFLKMCSWCKKVAAGGHGWVEIEDGIRILGLFAANGMPRITHTICKTCMNDIENEA